MDHHALIYNAVERHLKNMDESDYFRLMNTYNHTIKHVHTSIYPMSDFDHIIREKYKPLELIRHGYGLRHWDHYFTMLHRDLISYRNAEDYPYFVPMSELVNYIAKNEDPLGVDHIAKIFHEHHKSHIHHKLYHILKDCISDLDLVRLYGDYCDWLEFPQRKIFEMSKLNTVMQEYPAYQLIDLVDDSDNFSIRDAYFILREPESFSSDEPRKLLSDEEYHYMADMILKQHDSHQVYEVKEFLKHLDYVHEEEHKTRPGFRGHP